ncbi:phosphotransferase family protein [Kitasatospora viridis]|uniref:Phosphotransferase family enzyme n=1 Tax=Kitasatospora viridis TaxID=281105 RepID=A0A561TVL6_9ACTN|nr:aminoglycoside phosphotransferase family protein [Kitasatospora viridis]TWF91154.1 phosphotransferase family enzyme [Kitasatospora viridis]
MQHHDEKWLAEFARLGHPGAEPLAAGMEGAVYRLGGGLVAKVWAHRSAAELARLQEFCAELAGQGLGFRTPRIHAVHATGLGLCTVEDELSGRPLATALGRDGELPGPEVVDRVLDVLALLAAVPTPERLGLLPVLDETAPLRDGRTGWAEALIALIDRRLDRFGHLLARQVPGLDRRVARLRQLLRSRPAGRDGLVHGDLVTANILVDEDLRPTALLDFGFLTTPGDPAFDAAVTASIVDMYGPRARETEALFDDALVARFGYPRELLLLHRAAYALITSNAYDPAGADGHFRWCVRMLLRKDVAALLDGGNRLVP